MWWKILIGLYVLRSLGGNAPAPAQAAASPAPATTMPKLINYIPVGGVYSTQPMTDNMGASKIMAPAPAFGGSARYDF